MVSLNVHVADVGTGEAITSFSGDFTPKVATTVLRAVAGDLATARVAIDMVRNADA